MLSQSMDYHKEKFTAVMYYVYHLPIYIVAAMHTCRVKGHYERNTLRLCNVM